MRAADIMTTPVVTTGSADTVRTAADAMLRHRVASLPVIDHGRLVGIISEIDIARARAPHDPRSHLRRSPELQDLVDPAPAVGAVMTRDVVTVGPHDDVADLAYVMSQRGVRAVPVVDDGGGVVGIVSRRDVLRAVERDDAAIAREVVGRFAALGGDTHCPWGVEVRDGVVTVTGNVSDRREAEVLRVLASTVPGVVRTHIPLAADPVPHGRT